MPRFMLEGQRPCTIFLFFAHTLCMSYAIKTVLLVCFSVSSVLCSVKAEKVNNPPPGGYPQKIWVGVCGPLPKTLTLFMYQSNRSFNIPPRAYPGHLTFFPAREGGNLINLVFPGAGSLLVGGGEFGEFDQVVI